MDRLMQYGVAAVLWLVLAAAGECPARDVGQLISFKAGVSAQRDGQAVLLGMKSPVADKDLLITDATGRAQILFDDDTTVALGSDTALSLDTVVADGPRPAFRARLEQGVARFITGRIVEKNPDAFTVVTPDSRVDIRGTVFAVRVGKGTTTVFVTNTSKQVFVNGIAVPSGFKITLAPGGVVSLTPMTSSDAQMVSSSVAVGNVAAGSPASVSAALAQPSAPMAAGLAATPLAQQPLNSQTLADTTRSLSNANVSGTLLGSGNSAGEGSFSFNVNLGSGAVSNGVMAYQPIEATLSGGTGSISGSSLNVSGFSGTGSNATGYTGRMNGTAALSSSRLSVSGTFGITASPSANIGGTFSGSSR